MLRRREKNFGSGEIRHKVTELRLYSEDSETYYFEFKPVDIPADREMSLEDYHRYDSLYLFPTDCERLLFPILERLYPLAEPDLLGYGPRESFDPISCSYFGLKDWERLMLLIEEHMNNVSADEKEFYTEVLKFMRGFTEKSVYFCIDGDE